MKKPTIKTYRRACQIIVAVAFIIIPLLNHFRINTLTGNFLSFNAAGFPFADPLAVLQITLKNYYLSVDLLVGAGIALLLAASLGTVFCSWICPFGLLSEWGQALSRRIFPENRSVSSVTGTGFRIKMILFVLGLAGFLLFSTTPVLNQLSLPAWYSRIFQFYFEQRHVSMAILSLCIILFIEFVARKRLWCRYICPQAFLLVIAKIMNPYRLRVDFKEEKCICKEGQDPCQNACSLLLDPRTLKNHIETECNNCCDCVVACKKRGRALAFQQFDSFKKVG